VAKETHSLLVVTLRWNSRTPFRFNRSITSIENFCRDNKTIGR